MGSLVVRVAMSEAAQISADIDDRTFTCAIVVVFFIKR